MVIKLFCCIKNWVIVCLWILYVAKDRGACYYSKLYQVGVVKLLSYILITVGLIISYPNSKQFIRIKVFPNTLNLEILIKVFRFQAGDLSIILKMFQISNYFFSFRRQL